MYTLIFKDNNGKLYEVTARNIFTVWYNMGKYISMKYQIKISQEILRSMVTKGCDTHPKGGDNYGRTSNKLL